MRYLGLLLFLFIFTPNAYADDTKTLNEPGLGEWGYRHHELHQYNIPQQMGGKDCCSGADGGECRATVIHESLREVYLNGHWCAIPPSKTIQQLVLPNGIEAVVCAADNAYGREQYTMCPAMYCVATNPGFVENMK